MTELKRNAPNYWKIVEDVVRIEKKTFPKHESLSRSFDEELSKKNAGLLYSYVDGEVAGYVMYSWPSSLFAVITKLAGVNEAEVAGQLVAAFMLIDASLFVKEKYRRHGYGEALLRSAILKCQSRNIQRISLHVDPSRTPAVNLYEKVGFKIDSLVAKYYSADRDAYRVYLDLTPTE